MTLEKPLSYADYKGFTKEKTINTKVNKTYKPGVGKELLFTY